MNSDPEGAKIVASYLDPDEYYNIENLAFFDEQVRSRRIEVHEPVTLRDGVVKMVIDANGHDPNSQFCTLQLNLKQLGVLDDLLWFQSDPIADYLDLLMEYLLQMVALCWSEPSRPWLFEESVLHSAYNRWELENSFNKTMDYQWWSHDSALNKRFFKTIQFCDDCEMWVGGQYCQMGCLPSDLPTGLGIVIEE